MKIDPEVARLRVASRTDSGVHAKGQLAAFDTTHSMPPKAWAFALRPFLPATVAVRGAAWIPPAFEPRFVTIEKCYRYTILCDIAPDPRWAARAWRIEDIDDSGVQRMTKELESARGQHDFAAFRSARDAREHTERKLRALRVSRSLEDPRLLVLEVIGDHFMHRMVRILVGTAVDVGRGRLEPGAIVWALELKECSDAGVTAPPDGLCLEWVKLSAPMLEAWP
ncbi:hypothetical protein JYT22_00455 [Endomicrobium sp. AH-315-J14]|nr:hypothetical protein [Endomicrobium sp. AH-315-J14]